MKKLRIQLQLLIDKAIELGLPDTEIVFAGDFLEHNEYTQCLDHIAARLYHFGIVIDDECYHIIEEVAELMHIPMIDYAYLKELLPE